MRSLKETLYWASNKKIALAHFNISGFEQLKAISNVSRKLNLPVLVGVSESERKYLDVAFVKGWVDVINQKYGNKENAAAFWIFLNADHTHSLDLAKEAALNSFDEIVFDESDKSLKENIWLTKEAVKEIKKINENILVEGEVGYIGTSSEVWKNFPEGVSLDFLTKPEEAKEFVTETGVELLAPAVGNIHGMSFSGVNPRLNIKLISEIKKVTGVYLVLHGGSGISSDDFLAAIDVGINIIHISTEIRLAWRKSLEENLVLKPYEVAPYKIMEGVVNKIEKVIEEKMRLFYKL